MERWHIRRRNEGDRGAVAIEFALVLPLLVLLLLGTLTAGLSYSRAIGITNAVREGARFGATADSTSGTWAADVLQRVRDTQFDDPGEDTTVCVRLVGGASPVDSCDSGGDALIDYAPPATPTPHAGECIVQVWAARNYNITLVMLPTIDDTYNRAATARYERAC